MTVFLTFGDESYEQALRRIEQEAAASGFFDRVKIGRPGDLGDAFWSRHKGLLRTAKRGYGLWVWKPQLILDTLQACAPGEHLVYLDAGCSINAAGRARFEDYCRMAEGAAAGVLGFQIALPEKSYTKGDLFARLDAWHLKDTQQVLGGIIVMQRNAESLRFVEEWRALAEDHQLISDAPSVVPNDPSFVKHRHDQSVFSLLCKLRGAALIDDETFFEDWNGAGVFPFWATRLRGERRRRRSLFARLRTKVLPMSSE